MIGLYSSSGIARRARDELMTYIVVIAVLCVLILQASGSIPQSSVGGPLTIGLALIVAALVVGLYEAWTQGRGVVGWIVSIVVALLGAFIAAQLGGMIAVMAFSPFMSGSSSLAAAGGPVMYVALTVMTVVTLMGSWAALQIVNRWR